MMKKFMVPTLVAVATVFAFYACKKDVKSNHLMNPEKKLQQNLLNNNQLEAVA
jgi:hypothetical protein